MGNVQPVTAFGQSRIQVCLQSRVRVTECSGERVQPMQVPMGFCWIGITATACETFGGQIVTNIAN
jgi:hypothetical protein